MTSLVTTVIVCGVSSRGSVYFGELAFWTRSPCTSTVSSSLACMAASAGISPPGAARAGVLRASSRAAARGEWRRFMSILRCRKGTPGGEGWRERSVARGNARLGGAVIVRASSRPLAERPARSGSGEGRRPASGRTDATRSRGVRMPVIGTRELRCGRDTASNDAVAVGFGLCRHRQAFDHVSGGRRGRVPATVRAVHVGFVLGSRRPWRRAPEIRASGRDEQACEHEQARPQQAA